MVFVTCLANDPNVLRLVTGEYTVRQCLSGMATDMKDSCCKLGTLAVQSANEQMVRSVNSIGTWLHGLISIPDTPREYPSGSVGNPAGSTSQFPPGSIGNPVKA
mmetsp:Transcript_24423/g.38412  ORF Transcript_24423/g.38412 Transcript_24423/m.38412 type:complete len:104 (+) Transcript_24423:82-393(+)